MEWVLRSPQIHSTFSNLGFVHSDGYHVNENCNVFLETILNNIKTEDKNLRTYRRNISFGQNIEKDLIPLFLNAKDDKTIELLVKILVNLTIPVECLLSVDLMSRNDFGRHTIFEINNLLSSTKQAFTDHRASRVLIEFLKKNLETDQKSKLTPEQCANISNSLLLLRNILHIPEDNSGKPANFNGSSHSVQNQILWNLFSQSIDKVLIRLMTVSDAYYWGVTMVQLIALFYKDQHVAILQKLLNTWLESSLSESSVDNESNTSPPGRGRGDSSPMLTSDPTSDSSDTGTSGKSNDGPNSVNHYWEESPDNYAENRNQTFTPDTSPLPEEEGPNETQEKVAHVQNMTEDVDTDTAASSTKHSQSDPSQSSTGEKKIIISEISDCGYGTQIENQESVSTATSSNDDEPVKKPVHQKPHNPKQRANTKVRFGTTLQDRKRKKVAKRGKANIINVQGLLHNTPTDDDIANVLKEFTVDFLLKGYNSLVKTLHKEILTNLKLEIDTSHFFWLVTYFLKFASQMELDLQHLDSVLTFDIVSYLTAEGVNLCEQFELDIKVDGSDLTPNIRRLHLVVTSIREFVQALETYEKFSHLKKDDRDFLVKLQVKMCETVELRSLLVLLIRHYNPKYQSKQYLQDLIVTNHILLMFVDNVMRLPDYNHPSNMTDHMRQFASPHVMQQYGILLEDYMKNGQFVNDCIFTVMHHVSGDLDSLITLFQPKILRTFSSIWQSDFEICDDWSDLIEYVVNTFIKKPEALNSTANFRLETESFDDECFAKSGATLKEITGSSIKRKAIGNVTAESWTKEEISSLGWMYIQCEFESDSIYQLSQLLQEEGIYKSKESIIKELHKQKIIDEDKFKKFMRAEGVVEESEAMRDDEIIKLRDQLSREGKAMFLEWVQSVLLETCRVQIHLEKRKLEKCEAVETKLLNFELFKRKACDMPALSPVAYHSLVLGRSVPLVPWSCKQASICEDKKFFQLLHKLGFDAAVVTGKIFIRIPHFWTADYLYEVAGKIWPIDENKLQFCINELSEISSRKSEQKCVVSVVVNHDLTKIETQDNFYQVHKEKHLGTMVNFTPMPGRSYKTEASDIIPGDSQNWLKVVRQSQELEITLSNLGSFKDETARPTDMALSPQLGDDLSPQLPSAPLLIPAVMSVKQEISTYSVQLHDTECNSLCETASVASDLTRMYVSDEDEHADSKLVPPLAAIHADKLPPAALLQDSFIPPTLMMPPPTPMQQDINMPLSISTQQDIVNMLPRSKQHVDATLPVNRQHSDKISHAVSMLPPPFINQKLTNSNQRAGQILPPPVVKKHDAEVKFPAPTATMHISERRMLSSIRETEDEGSVASQNATVQDTEIKVPPPVTTSLRRIPPVDLTCDHYNKRPKIQTRTSEL